MSACVVRSFVRFVSAKMRPFNRCVIAEIVFSAPLDLSYFFYNRFWLFQAANRKQLQISILKMCFKNVKYEESLISSNLDQKPIFTHTIRAQALSRHPLSRPLHISMRESFCIHFGVWKMFKDYWRDTLDMIINAFYNYCQIIFLFSVRLALHEGSPFSFHSIPSCLHIRYRFCGCGYVCECVRECVSVFVAVLFFLFF